MVLRNTAKKKRSYKGDLEYFKFCRSVPGIEQIVDFQTSDLGKAKYQDTKVR